jgi:hypothetical protein
MNQIQQAELKSAEAMRDRVFTVGGMRHRIQDVYFADYADEVVVEVRIWTAPNRSHIETWNLRELKTRMS